MNPYKRKTAADASTKTYTAKDFEPISRRIEALYSDVDDIRSGLAKIAEHLDSETTQDAETTQDIAYEVSLIKEITERFLAKHVDAVLRHIEKL